MGTCFPKRIEAMTIASEKKCRIVVALAADAKRNPSSEVKYKYLINALMNQFQICETINSQPKNLLRVLVAALNYKFNRDLWRESINKNILGFRLSSWLVNRRLDSRAGEVDFSIQIGCLFDFTWPKKRVPNFIYTDYTSILSSEKPHAGRSPFSPRQLKKWIQLEKNAYHAASHIFVRSNYVKKSLLDDYQIQNDKISIVGGGWNFDLPPPEVKRSYTGVLNILFIGKRFHRKGGDILLEAFHKLVRVMPNVSLTIVTDDDIPLEFNHDQITVFKPIWDRKVIHSLYQNAHLFVLPSRLETWGDVLLEAMVYGIPCIGVNTDAMPEIIEDGVNGIIAEGNNPEVVFKSMLNILQNPEKMKRFGQEARRVALSQFNWEKTVNKIYGVINEKMEMVGRNSG